MSISKQRIFDVCKVECDRQQVGEYAHRRLIKTYEYCMENVTLPLTFDHLFEISGRVDGLNANVLRNTPVTFANLSHGVDPTKVPRALASLFAHQDQLTTDEFVVEFLKIHPFKDGNGRVAFLLYNILNNSLDDPAPLPDYFKET